MGGQRPDTDFCNFLEVIHFKKRRYGEKNYLNYYPFGLKHKGYNNIVNGTDYPYGYNGKEENDELGLEWLDFGARNYDASLGRWMNIDNLSETYYALTPYNYGGNTPINTIDVDGNLFIFVNGFMLEQWIAGTRSPSTSAGPGTTGSIPNPRYKKYAPDRGFYKNGARNNGSTFRYWTQTSPSGAADGVNLLYQRTYKDNNAYYTNGSYTPLSTASARFKGGQEAAKELIKKLDNKEITLKDGETIKIVGHSHGAAHAAGMASELLKHSIYGSRLEFVDYIAAHQPNDFESPEGLQSRQFLTWSDWVVKEYLINFNGGTGNGCIRNSKCEERDSYEGGRGGHSVNTYLDYIANYFRGLGIDVSVEN